MKQHRSKHISSFQQDGQSNQKPRRILRSPFRFPARECLPSSHPPIRLSNRIRIHCRRFRSRRRTLGVSKLPSTLNHPIHLISHRNKRANLARQNHSVLLLEAGQDHGDTDLQRVPFFADANSEHPNMSWEFFVSHYQNDTQAQLDSKFTWRTPNGSYHVGSSNPPPPEGSEALGIFYPRTGTLGGCAQHNAMNMVYPPDEDWEFIADLTGDDGFSAEHMRELFVRLERSEFFPEGTEGHGFDGYLSVS